MNNCVFDFISLDWMKNGGLRMFLFMLFLVVISVPNL